MLGAACVSVAAEAASNALFAYELGGLAYAEIRGVRFAVDGALLAGVSVALATFQAHAATSLMAPEAPNRRANAAVLGVCLAYSIGAMASHTLKLQQASLDRETRERRVYESARADTTAAEAAAARALAEYQRREAAAIGSANVRPVATIDADLAALKIRPDTWKLTDRCTARLDISWAREACEPALALYRERTAAAKATGDVSGFATARAELDRAERAAADARAKLSAIAAPSDPWKIRVVLAMALPWVVTIALELCATLGFGLARRPPARPAPVDAAPIDPPTPRARHPPRPSTLAALLEGVMAGTTSAPGCTITADGWIDASQRELGTLLGCTAATVCREIEALETAGRIARRKIGRKQQIKMIMS